MEKLTQAKQAVCFLKFVSKDLISISSNPQADFPDYPFDLNEQVLGLKPDPEEKNLAV